MTIDYKIGVKKLQYINRDAGIMSALLLTGLDMRGVQLRLSWTENDFFHFCALALNSMHYNKFW